jgi:hypothetical protein
MPKKREKQSNKKNNITPLINEEDLDRDEKSHNLAISFLTSNALPQEHMDLKKYVGRVRRNLKIEAKIGDDEQTRFQGVAIVLDALSSAMVVKGLLDKWIIEKLSTGKKEIVDDEGKVLPAIGETYPKYIDLVTRLANKFYEIAEDNMSTSAGGKRKGNRKYVDYGKLFLQIEEDKRKLIEENEKTVDI